MSRRRKFLLVVLFFSLAAGTFAQQKPFKVNVDTVMLSASVTDAGNKLVTDLKASDFQIFEDKIAQDISFFSTEEAPISLGIVFDTSHSMERKISMAREAASTFLESGTSEDEYFLVEFNSRAKVTEDFTSDIARLKNHLSFVPPNGSTALYDAVYLGMSKVRKGQNPKKALLLITDGEDNHSHYSRNDILEIARESDVQIYSIDLGRALIRDLSDMTGGHSFRGKTDDLQDICSKIAQELKRQYVLGYVSTNTNKDGKYRKVRVKVNSPVGMPKLNIRARDGYYAPTD